LHVADSGEAGHVLTGDSLGADGGLAGEFQQSPPRGEVGLAGEFQQPVSGFPEGLAGEFPQPPKPVEHGGEFHSQPGVLAGEPRQHASPMSSWLDIQSNAAMTERSLDAQSTTTREDFHSPEKGGVSTPENKDDNQDIASRQGELPEVHDRELRGLDAEALRAKLRDIATQSVQYKNSFLSAEEELTALKTRAQQNEMSWSAERERMIDDLRQLRDGAGGAVSENEKLFRDNGNLKRQLEFVARDHSRLQAEMAAVGSMDNVQVRTQLEDAEHRAQELEKITAERDAQLIEAAAENDMLDESFKHHAARAHAAEQRVAELETKAAATKPAEPPTFHTFEQEALERALERGLSKIRDENEDLRRKHAEQWEQSQKQVLNLINNLQTREQQQSWYGKPHAGPEVSGPIDSFSGKPLFKASDDAQSNMFFGVGSSATLLSAKQENGREFRDGGNRTEKREPSPMKSELIINY